VLLGASCGAAVVFPLRYLVFGPKEAVETSQAIVLPVIMAVMGALAAGLLSATGWALLGGGAITAMATGLAVAIATRHVKGFYYSWVGALLYVVLVILYWLRPLAAKPSDKTEPSPGAIRCLGWRIGPMNLPNGA
jgi:hypothetical protein